MNLNSFFAASKTMFNEIIIVYFFPKLFITILFLFTKDCTNARNCAKKQQQVFSICATFLFGLIVLC